VTISAATSTPAVCTGHPSDGVPATQAAQQRPSMWLPWRTLRAPLTWRCMQRFDPRAPAGTYDAPVVILFLVPALPVVLTQLLPAVKSSLVVLENLNRRWSPAPATVTEAICQRR
jgi:hypothetical protein